MDVARTFTPAQRANPPGAEPIARYISALAQPSALCGLERYAPQSFQHQIIHDLHDRVEP
jgi:hypothetical protein